MKAVFLDVDGVLNSTEHLMSLKEVAPATSEEEDTIFKVSPYLVRGYPKDMLLHDMRSIDSKAVALLNNLLERSRAKVVISSSWRHLLTLSVIQGLLEHQGFKGEPLGMTPLQVEAPPGCGEALRGHEIQAWLTEHPEVDRFVILDDDTDMAHLEDRLVRTEFAVGLTVEDVERALVLLNP